MAKATFITLYDKGCLGVRYLSSSLKKEGHKTSIIYMGKHGGRLTSSKNTAKEGDNLWISVNEFGADLIRSYSDPISGKDVEILLGLLDRQKPDIIGFSLRTMFLETAITLTEKIRSVTKAPIIYGGIAASSEPEKCIRYADMICVGEGEKSMLMLADRISQKGSLKDINNIWVRENGTVYKNPLFPLEQDLDKIPFPDYEASDKFSILNSKLIENDPSIGNMSAFTYEIETSRGCPFGCTYCCNDLLRRLYAGQNYLRRRSVNNVIDELKGAKSRYNIKSVLFKDEIFTFDLGWIKEFSDLYKNEVGLPFWCYTHPSFADETILRLLKGCGMFSITMGIQSGSENVLYNIFNRRTSYDKIVKSAFILEDLKLPVRPRFDIITNNPFETEDDRDETLKMLMDLPKPVNFGLTKLSFIPGSRISEILRDKAVDKKTNDNLYKFWNTLFLLNQYSFFPNSIIRFLRKSSFFRKNPGFLKILLFPKFLEIKSREAVSALKGALPSPVVLGLKRIRLALKGY